MEVLGKVLTAFCHQPHNHPQPFLFEGNQVMYIIFCWGKKGWEIKCVSETC